MAIVDIYRTRRRYAAIYADAPWPYGPTSSRKMRGGLPYKVMTVREIADLPIERLAAEDCELWMWTTGPFIHDALHIVDAWGFTYRTKRVWAKSRMGTGFWVRGQTEDILIASRGNPRVLQVGAGQTRPGASLSSLLVTRSQQHSRKPRESYEDFESVTRSPRLELFARRARKGWDAWGHEAKEPDEELVRDVDQHVRRAR